ncbi:MAG: IclR family transcriptional regulator [Rhizobiales bacterium]|nr:IclR family transcriptional regulator [Hyphomicrobiales bacterium]
MNTSEKPAKQVNALSRGIAILRYLDSQGEPVGVVQIARDLKINASTCFNLLRTLVHERLAIFDPATKKYSPGLGVLALAHAALKQDGHIQLLHPQLEQIANAHKVTVMLWQLTSPDRAMVVDLAEASTPLRVQFTVGQRLPSLIGALGRCFAGHLNLSKADIKVMFKELRWQNAPTFEQYWSDVEDARRSGYAVDIGRYNRNFTTVAAPILAGNGEATMAISAITFSGDLDRPRMLRLAADLKRVTGEASNALGYSGSSTTTKAVQAGRRKTALRKQRTTTAP